MHLFRPALRTKLTAMAIIRIRGVLVDMLVEIALDVYKDFVTTDKKGTKQLIVKCMNAIYGTMVASLLYYRKFECNISIAYFEAYDIKNKTIVVFPYCYFEYKSFVCFRIL
jgi:hypothetical protein